MNHKEKLMKLKELFEGVNDKNIFKAIIIVGSPGSGKSFIVNKLALRSQGLVKITTDQLFEKFLKQYNLSFKMPDNELNIREPLRRRAFELTQNKMQLLIDGRVGLVIEGTGYIDRTEELVENLEGVGYDVCMIYVNTSLDVAQQRNMKRERSLPTADVERLWNNAQRNKQQLEQMFGPGFYEVDSSNSDQVIQLDNKIKKWLSQPVSSPVARQWIRDQRTK